MLTASCLFHLPGLATDATNGYSFPMTGMTRTEFLKRFADDQEIGRDITATHVAVYYDNGQNVGRWIEDRRTTQGYGEPIDREHAEAARHWCKRLQQQQRDAAAQATGCSR
jgi:hypothetical protein